MLRLLLISLALLTAPAAADLDLVRQEPNLERRSDKALEAGTRAVDTARTAYTNAEYEAFKQQLALVRDAADLSYKSLKDTGKDARKNPKYFKRADFALRAIMRKLDALAQEVGIDDRASVEEVRKHVSDVHDQVLTDIMTKKQK